MPPRVLVDGDSSGRRDILFELCLEFGAELHWVHNPHQRAPYPVEGLKFIEHLADAESQAADMLLMNLAGPGDIVVTADIGLAAVVIAKHAAALSPRGHWYYEHRMADSLELRHLLKEARARGENPGGGPAKARRFDEEVFERELRKALSGETRESQ